MNTGAEKLSVSCQSHTLKKTLLSPAKLNFGLSLIGRRQDEYHLLESLFWPIDFCDQIEIENATSSRLKVQWHTDAPFKEGKIPEGENNLLSKVLQAFGNPNFSITLKKRIPMGAGLGGGSSNAGTLIRELGNQLGLSAGKCHKLATELGADVPFFLAPQPTWVEGIGDKLTPIRLSSLPQIEILLVLLPIQIPTSEIFQCYRGAKTFFSKPHPHIPTTSETELFEYLKTTRNDLEPTVMTRYPIVGTVLEYLHSLPCHYVGLSGSGSACFAILKEKHPDPIKDSHNFFRSILCKSFLVQTFTN